MGQRGRSIITTDFITQDTTGNLVCKKVPVFIGNPGEAYVLICVLSDEIRSDYMEMTSPRTLCD
jgi:hypothetical protein